MVICASWYIPATTFHYKDTVLADKDKDAVYGETHCQNEETGFTYPSRNVDCQNMIDHDKNMFNHGFKS